ncbi:MAG: hypothetical protein M3Q55_13810 [Acidobacteriota bacterium]|nr:hypothetical protein [Acidobacteriota bacterium]
MTARIFLGAAALAIASLLMTLQPQPDGRDTTAPQFDAPGAAARSDLARRQPADGQLDMPRLYETATRQVEALERFSSAIGRHIPAAQPPSRLWRSGSSVVLLDGTSSATGVLDAWTPLGPGNIGGRTRVVRFHPTVPTRLFAAGVSGGIWRSNNSGASWQPMGDGLTNIAVNALLIDPARPNVMYAGTGEGYFREEIRGTGLPLRGSGIYMTTDGAKTWQQLPATKNSNFHWVNDLEFGVNDSRRIYAATRSGVWRSTDSGATWKRLLATTVRGGCLDLALRPDKAEDVLFASCGSYEQATVYRFPRAALGSDREVVLREPDMGRTSLAISPSKPDVMYALAASNATGPQGIYEQGLLAVYRSASGGKAGSWETRVDNHDPTFLNTMLLTNTSTAAARVCSPQGSNALPVTMGWYNNVIAVDPRDPDRVWAAGVDWFRSDDGGRNWGLASWGNPNLPAYSHVDQHTITFHPKYNGESNQIVLIGNDGGVFRSTNARAATSNGPQAACTGGQPIQVAWTSLNRGYGVTQFYHGSPFPDGTQYLGGTQDNGTLLGSDDAGPDGWTLKLGGDGSFSAVHPTQTGTWLMSSQFSNVGRTTNAGATVFQARTGLDQVIASVLGPEGNFLFITPFTADPSSDIVWIGGEFLYRSDTFGQNWGKAISSQTPNGARVSAIAISPNTSAIVFAGTDQGHILRTTNGTDAVSAIAFTTTQPRQGWVTSIAVAPNSGVVYATYGNFGGKHVYRSVDNGETWHSLDGTGKNRLPDIPVHSIVVDPDNQQRLYLGTDLGVMVSTNGGATWMTEETGFGPAVTMWLSLIRTPGGQKQLFAFTHGRGVWRVAIK